MKKSLIIAAVAASLITLGGCKKQETKSVSAAPAKSAEQASYEAALSSANAAIKKAHAAGNEWRDTGKIVKSAKAAAGKGEYYKAKKLAQKAEEQAHLATKQAHSQKNAGNPGYLY